jgi:hypothetical protein
MRSELRRLQRSRDTARLERRDESFSTTHVTCGALPDIHLSFNSITTFRSAAARAVRQTTAPATERSFIRLRVLF